MNLIEYPVIIDSEACVNIPKCMPSGGEMYIQYSVHSEMMGIAIGTTRVNTLDGI